jgi:hypothetical protein
MRKSDQVVFTIISDTDYSLSEKLWNTYKILWSNYRTMNPKLNEYKIKVKNRERAKELYKIFEESNDVSSISCINERTTLPEFF